MFQLRVGDKVRFLDDIGSGVVLSVAGQVATILRDDGFEVKMSFRNLVPDRPPRDYRVSFPPAESAPAPVKKKPVERVDCPEIDLHIECLVDDHSRMTNAEIMIKQLAALKTFLQRVQSQRARRAIIIHGVGEGVLKEEVWRELRKFDTIEFFDAPYRQYGYGATEVHFRYR
jgi:dsDNA-specific endonuclease/ATPase MutS2